ncbi:hypothetical protein ACJX0J_023798, partial [Zea mays]
SYLSFTSGPLPCLNRNTRETTPCSLINSEMISTPGSTTRSSHSSHRRVKAPPVHAIPSSTEMNEYFAAEQRRQQQAFIDKYNFDPLILCRINELLILILCDVAPEADVIFVLNHLMTDKHTRKDIWKGHHIILSIAGDEGTFHMFNIKKQERIAGDEGTFHMVEIWFSGGITIWWTR